MRRVLSCSVLTLCFCLLENGCSKGITRATAATVFFATGNVVFGNAERNDFQPVTSKSKIHAGDTVRTSNGASINLALIPGAFVQLSGNSEIKIQDLRLTKDRKSTRLNSSHRCISYAVFCLKKKTPIPKTPHVTS